MIAPSDACLALVKASEGCRLTAYRDLANVLTIGYGHTHGVTEGQTITQAQADAMLLEDVDDAWTQVSGMLTVEITQGECDALTDFCFNLGAGRLRNSTLLRLLNAGNVGGASQQFKYWVFANGMPQKGLITRRAAEKALFDAQRAAFTSARSITSPIVLE